MKSVLTFKQKSKTRSQQRLASLCVLARKLGMKITIPFVAIATVLFIGSILLWVESGRSYNNFVAPLGNFKVVAEMKDFSIDLQLTFPEDPISHGLHGYAKNSWSDASPFGRFEVVRLFGKPDGKIPYYSQIIFPSWFLAVLPFTLLFFSLKLVWQHRRKRPEVVSANRLPAAS